MIYSSGIEFVEAFWACLYARLIAVPAYPPRSNIHGLSRLQAIRRDCSPQLILSSRGQLEDLGNEFQDIPALATDEVPDSAAQERAMDEIQPEDIALLQYSSGSTASPKGIIVTHRNIYANQVMIQRAFRHSETSTFVGWLPFFHDMGLFGNIIQPLFIGAHCVLMSPLAFLQKPVRWLKAISDYQAHSAGAPNFGYEYCVKRIREKDKAGLDLSCWKRAFNGAEKPRVETIQRFTEAFAPTGFREESFYPCYGLAEAVLFVTGRNTLARPQIGRATPAAKSERAKTGGGRFAPAILHISSGCSWLEERVAIVNPETSTVCSDGSEGEIWVKGPNVAKGYWDRPSLTDLTFNAFLADGSDGPFLRTGDLGFMQDGELYVAGRLKDLIILRGQNYHPEDIEASVEGCHDELAPGQCAAFSLEGGPGEGVGERLIVMIEVGKTIVGEPALQSLCDKAAATVSLEFGIGIGELLLVGKGTIPKTSSGKVQRFRCQELFLAGELDPIKQLSYEEEGLHGEEGESLDVLRRAIRASRGGARRRLVRESLSRRLCKLLPLASDEGISQESSLLQHGLDSVRAVELKHWIGSAFDVSVAVGELFDNASVDALADRIEADLPRRELTAEGAESAQEIQPAASGRLSYGQQALFFEYQKDPASAAYNISAALRLSGQVDRDRLTGTLSALLRRQPHLGTTFVSRGGKVTQQTLFRDELPLEFADASCWSEEELLRRVSRGANRPFELSESGIRFVVYSVGDIRSVLLIVVHHLLIDLFSFEILLSELTALYGDDGPRKQRPADSLPQSTYAEFVSWQDRFVSSAPGEESLRFWRGVLAGCQPSPRLAFIRSWAADRKRTGRVCHFGVGRQETAAIKALAAREQATPYMVLLSAYAVLLGQFARQSNLVVGTSVTGRPSHRYSDVLGHFVNMLALPLSVDPRCSFRQVLRQAKSLVSSALDHQHYPFSLLVDKLSPELGLDRGSLVRYAFTYGQARYDESILGLLNEDRAVQNPFGPLRATGFPLRRQMAPFDLTLMILEREGYLDASFSYAANLVQADAFPAFAEAFQRLLSALVSHPSEPISRLTIEAAQDRVPDSLAQGERDYASVLQRFERRAQANPGAIALWYQDQHVSYAELNRRAARLGHWLRRRGVGPESVVVVHCPRGIEMLMGILGILKADGAYLPVDVTYPPERLHFVTQDAKARLVLTVAAYAGRCVGSAADPVLLDAEWKAIQAENPVPASPPPHPNQLAYIIYTSGSTGSPKGVGISHGNASRLFDSTRRCYSFAAQDAWILFHSISFDFSVWEMWGALTYGGRLTILDQQSARDPERVYQHILQEQITVLNQTPSAFYGLLAVIGEKASRKAALPLRYVVFGGEALKYDQLDPWFDHPCSAGCKLVNMYGITETTVHTTWLVVARRHLSEGAASPIGQGLEDVGLYILNSGHNRLPAYAVGEIAVSGKGLARGYYSQPALTAARFIPDPFSGTAGSRLYLTGDLAYGKPGCKDVCYLGRLDQQVKIRGHRIELGEIETHLGSCQGVSWAMVLATKEPDANSLLSAYLVGRQGLTASMLRDRLLQFLPEYMIPARFIRVASVPFTENGKVDLARLRSCTELLESGTAYAAPRNEAERTMARIWAEVLHTGQIGIDENYFALGGDSIRSIQLISKAKKAGLSIELTQLLRGQTIRRLSECLPSQPASERVVWSKPFELVPEEDRRRLPDGLDDAFPVESLSQGLIFHSQFSEDYQVYVSTFQVRAPWHPEKLKAAIAAAVSRHPYLRSSFDDSSFSEPLQLVHASAPIQLSVEDIRDLAPEDQESSLQGWIEEQKWRKFDWRRAPLLRFAAHRRSNDSFQVTMSEPYLDGWCVALLYCEIFETYLALARSEELPHCEPTQISQRHFVQLERSALADQASRQFWMSYLEKAPDSLLSSVIYKQVLSPRTLHGRKTIAIPDSVLTGLERTASLASVPLRTIFLAAHAHLLAVILGRDEVVFGVILNGRPEEADGDKAIGSFLNTVPFRIEVKRHESWIEHVRRVFSTETRIVPHRRFPFAEIKKLCAGALRFDTVFNFTYFHALESLQSLDGFRILNVYASEQTFFPLTAHFNRSILTSELELVLDYNCRELSAAQIDLIADCYFKAFEEIAADAQAESGIGRASSILDRHLFPVRQPEHGRVWTESSQVSGLSAIECQVDKSPHAVALVMGEQSLTYGQLQSKAQALAAHLAREVEIGAEDLVGIFAQRSLDGIIGTLAVLNCGAAYVPIDEDCPEERIEFMISDCRPKCILTEQALAGRLESGGIPVLCLDRLFPQGHGTEGAVLEGLPRDPANLAYLMYTSGSTGWPKGVEVPHSSLANFAASAIIEYGIRGDDRILQFSTTEFDNWVEEIFTCLGAGATLLLRPFDLLDSYDTFHDFCLLESVSCLDLPTVFWKDWARESLSSARPFDLPVRLVILGGVKMAHDLALRWKKALPEGVLLVNTYGPTETTVAVTRYWIGSEDGGFDAAAQESSPIGSEFGNAVISILDPLMRPVAPGVCGELHIGGIGVARGYHNLPRLSAERFTPDPQGLFAGARRYRSGDIGYYGMDGNLHFVGRVDLQVKIRGFRVELEEVEAALLHCIGVKQAAVIAAGPETGAVSLMAYLQLEDPSRQDAQPEDQIRRQLERKLPPYMIPASIRLVEGLPTTVSGKIDRRALKQLASADPRLPSHPAKTCADPWAKIVLGVCQHCLGLEHARPEDNFFALGGDSLVAMRVVARLNTALSCQVSVRDIFEYPHIGRLSERLRQRAAAHTPQEPEAEPLGQDEQVLSFDQERLWMAEQLSFDAATYNIPAAITIKGKFNSFAFEQSVREVQRRHSVLKTRVIMQEGNLAPVYDETLDIELVRVDLSLAAEAARENSLQQYRSEHVQARFDLERDALIRVALLVIGPEEYQLSIAIHHIVADGWSNDLLIRELLQLYSDFAQGSPSSLPDLPIQYADYARRQRAKIRGSYKDRLLHYWQGNLEGMPEAVELPFDYNRPAFNEFKGRRHYFTVDRELVASFGELGRSQGFTLFMILLAAYKALLHQRSGQTDIVVGTPVSNRDWPDTESIIGLFVNQLVARTDLSGTPTFRQLLGRVRKGLLSAYDHRDLPFEELVSFLKPRRDAGISPLVQTVFAYWDRPWQDFTIEGLELEFPEVHNRAAKYDLEVQLVDQREGGMEGYFEYNVSLFSQPTIQRLAQDYVEVLRTIAEQPDCMIGARLPQTAAAIGGIPGMAAWGGPNRE